MKRVILIGQPNSGKSTFFSQVSGTLVHTSNFPGTTVSISKAHIKLSDQEYEIIDLPGTYALYPTDEAERVTLDFLLKEEIDIIVNVLDATLIWRSLELTLELTELGKPMVVVLNMMDEAERKGIKIDVNKLQEILGVKVIPAVSIHGKGIYETVKAFRHTSIPKKHLFTRHVEELIEKLAEEVGSRFLALKYIESALPPPPSVREKVKAIVKKIERAHGMPAFEIIASERHHLSLKIAEEVTEKILKREVSLEEKLDRFLLHPFFGYLFLLIAFVLLFFTVFVVGSALESILIDPLDSLTTKISNLLPAGILRYAFNGLMMGITGGIAVVIPYLLPLITLISFFEDLGYLSRVAFLMDVFMHKIGLHGKSVVPFILGYGCTVPALMSTRILDNKGDRILAALLIPFVPCSARTTVILAIVAYFLGLKYVLLLYFLNVLVIGLIGRILSSFSKSPSLELLIEVPSFKLPSLKVIFKKVLFQMEEFIFRAWPILILGSVLIAVLQYFGFEKLVNSILSPLTSGILGLPRELGVTLIFGFLRKELTLMMTAQALGVKIPQLSSVLSSSQIFVFATFITYYIPCLSTVVVMWKEFGRKIALFSMALSLLVAVLLSGIIGFLF